MAFTIGLGGRNVTLISEPTYPRAGIMKFEKHKPDVIYVLSAKNFEICRFLIKRLMLRAYAAIPATAVFLVAYTL